MNSTPARRAWPLTATHLPNARPSWAEWSALQARRIERQRRFGDLPFSDRELARLTFLRWLYQTDRLAR